MAKALESAVNNFIIIARKITERSQGGKFFYENIDLGLEYYLSTVLFNNTLYSTSNLILTRSFSEKTRVAGIISPFFISCCIPKIII